MREETTLYDALKRLCDIAMSLGALIALAPVLIGIAAVLIVTGEHLVLYAQERVGQANTRFRLFKFVTMSEATVDTGTVTESSSSDILPIGRVLRATKLNELPQLWNVLRGEMSIVGPRPLTARSFEFYPEALKPWVVQAKPGLTGMGSLFFSDETEVVIRSGKSNASCYREDIMPLKGELERWYCLQRSLWVDVKVIAATALLLAAPHSKFFIAWFEVRNIVENSTLRSYFLGRTP